MRDSAMWTYKQRQPVTKMDVESLFAFFLLEFWSIPQQSHNNIIFTMSLRDSIANDKNQMRCDESWGSDLPIEKDIIIGSNVRLVSDLSSANDDNGNTDSALFGNKRGSASSLELGMDIFIELYILHFSIHFVFLSISVMLCM